MECQAGKGTETDSVNEKNYKKNEVIPSMGVFHSHARIWVYHNKNTEYGYLYHIIPSNQALLDQ